MTNEPWDDDRLDAAYTARSEGHPTPSDLTATTIRAIRSGARPTTVSRWPRILAAAAAVIVVVGGLAIAGLGSRGPNLGAATPSDAAAEATVSPAASESSGAAAASAPTEVAGLKVISVNDAIAIRDRVDRRELAVRGWYMAMPLPCPSMVPGPSSPIEPTCDNEISWLMRDDEDLSLPGSGRPNGPAIHAYLGDVGGLATPSPVDVVVIGHFDDRRTAQCPADAKAACRDAFVVDRICWVDGTELELSSLNELDRPTTSTDHEVASTVLEFAPQATILSALTVTGDDLADTEPAFRTRDEYRLTDEAGVWIVKVVVDGSPVTFFVVDGTLEAYMMAADGRAQQARPFSPGVRFTDPWPPSGAAIVDVPGVEIAVVDLSNHLLGARAASLDGTTLPPDVAAKPIHLAETTTSGELLLTWSGSGCDRRASVTVGRSLTTISVERIEAPNCEGDARTYGLILTFDDPVDVDTVELSTTRRVAVTP
jgi:hypothetical protein